MLLTGSYQYFELITVKVKFYVIISEETVRVGECIVKTLVLLSELTRSKPIDNKLKNLFEGRSFKLGYIPSQTDESRKYFHKAQEFFTYVGVNEFVYFDVDKEFDGSRLEELTSCDGIYLSGGNTFYFLKNLQERNMLTVLKGFVAEGKILLGVSAGAIIMSKTIEMASLLDDNIVNLEDLTSLGIVDFETVPHWNDQLQKLQDRRRNIVYGLQDGDGIFIQGERIELIGSVYRVNYQE
ncbi:hypothetical protein FZW96_13280 [Bacillus sp. BGMRC 2118]|nr:hypothetical protein FZW96_13280 [Bacillus sp. BGMRC 2118]